MGKFSERIGAVEPRKTLQLEVIDDDLRNSLWNVLHTLYNHSREDYWRMVAKHVAKFFRKSPVDELPFANCDCKQWIKSYFYKLQWYEVYDFVEFVVDNHEEMTRKSLIHGYDYIYHNVRKPDLLDHLNHILERELSGYRFISGLLSPISDKIEIESIESAIGNADTLGLVGVKEHIRTAIELFGKKPQPDFRNAIKEAISSVESIAKIISGSNSQGLNGALNEIGKMTDIHGALKGGFIKLYGYSSDEDGVRHAILEQPNIGFAEAKYMIVSCSAFVNYLIEKANKTGLLAKK